MNAPAPAAPVSFAALRHRGFRAYFLLSALAMMADNIEHVISYWVVHERFDSPALGGFAVVSHWLPFLLFSVYSGALADRLDPRRMIQLGMALLQRVAEDTAEIAKVEAYPRMEGRQMLMVLSPK